MSGISIENAITQFQNTLSGQNTGTLLCVIVALFIICSLFIKGTKKIAELAGMIFAGLVFMQLMHIFTYYTELGNFVPVLKQIFQWDFLAALAESFSGTKFGEICTTLDAWLIVALQRTAILVQMAFSMLSNLLKG